MKALVALACAALLVIPAGAQSPQVRVIVGAELHRGARVRVQPSYAAVPAAVQQATVRALQDAGLVVVTTEQRQPDEDLLMLSAHCQRDWMRRWRCTEFAARLVDRETAEVHATATLNPLARPATRLSSIQAALRTGFVFKAAP